MEHEYTVAELKKMLLEAKKKRLNAKKQKKKRKLIEQKESRQKEIADLQRKIDILIEHIIEIT